MNFFEFFCLLRRLCTGKKIEKNVDAEKRVGLGDERFCYEPLYRCRGCGWLLGMGLYVAILAFGGCSKGQSKLSRLRTEHC